MRRSIAAALVAMSAAASAALSLAPATASSATDGTARITVPANLPVALPPAGQATGTVAAQQARRALDHARQVLTGAAPAAASGSRPEATLAMRDLFAALPDLSPSDRRAAHSVLARPTDGSRDPYGDGYTVPAKRKCKGHFCIHWVPTTSDAPPSATWVDKSLKTMNRVWQKEVGDLGYRAPVKDGKHGGNNLFDVYLKDVGSQGLYGYCAPEYLKPGRTREASGYCVLDNDFSSSQFGGAQPVDSLRVTAAHEFFHAVQFGYDYKEDHWMMEATSTWMEERFADSINDNRQYLPYGQVRLPYTSLDVYNPSGFNQYGNWPFFEYLSSHYGAGLVRQIWNLAGNFPGAGKQYSTQAISSALRSHGGFTSVFGGYAAANVSPAQSYAEGSAWPSAKIDRHWTLARDHRSSGARLSVNHMAARDVVMQPDATLRGSRWRGRVVVDAPGRAKSPAVVVVIDRIQGKPIRKQVALSRSGAGSLSFAFSHATVKRVSITLANASTRFDCGQHTNLSCHGKPKDNDSNYAVKVSAFKR